MSFWSSIGKAFKSILPFAPIIGPVIGSLIGASSAKSVNEQQIQQSNQLFDKQKQETDTSHQREVEDLKLAGLNPILSAKYGGSASATGAMPKLNVPFEDAGKDFSSASQISLNQKLTKAQVKNIKAQTLVNSATALRTLEEAKQSKMRTQVQRKAQWSKTNPFFESILAPAQRFKETLLPSFKK